MAFALGHDPVHHHAWAEHLCPLYRTQIPGAVRMTDTSQTPGTAPELRSRKATSLFEKDARTPKRRECCGRPFQTVRHRGHRVSGFSDAGRFGDAISITVAGHTGAFQRSFLEALNVDSEAEAQAATKRKGNLQYRGHQEAYSDLWLCAADCVGAGGIRLTRKLVHPDGIVAQEANGQDLLGPSAAQARAAELCHCGQPR